ncbi:peptidase inhibitor family I36 protein [Actinoplanes sp. L3-i22]|uniref:peptidase inhibitor family I36 protein n=1 Tax=Actinoplanes sp. L3-i22 TaxID=2836373 RepID=UPI001C762FFE|nr:peptidase inhibitor family I36 protein [Actinoplanes sp. L3-i22]BCY11763.1 hypothetical protein L3i22_068510 [Actinoplanes sp. L3-i22]
MKKSTVLRGLLGSAVAVGASLVVLPSAAQAVYYCKAKEVCVYSEHNARGSVLVIKGGTHNFLPGWVFQNGLAANDNASSIVNYSGHNVIVSSDYDSQGIRALAITGYITEFYGQAGSLPDNSMSFVTYTQ